MSLSLLLSVTGVSMLLVSRCHYSIDCLVAYWVTSRVWWTYHTMANTKHLQLSGSHNHMDNIWWWYVARYNALATGGVGGVGQVGRGSRASQVGGYGGVMSHVKASE